MHKKNTKRLRRPVPKKSHYQFALLLASLCMHHARALGRKEGLLQIDAASASFKSLWELRAKVKFAKMKVTKRRGRSRPMVRPGHYNFAMIINALVLLHSEILGPKQQTNQIEAAVAGLEMLYDQHLKILRKKAGR